jgi:hypothetical protein
LASSMMRPIGPKPPPRSRTPNDSDAKH